MQQHHSLPFGTGISVLHHCSFSVTAARRTKLRTTDWWFTLLLSEFMWKMERQAFWMCEYLWEQKSLIFTPWPTKHGTSCSSYIFPRWNIVFCSSIIISIIIFVIKGFVWDISEKSFDGPSWWKLMCSPFRSIHTGAGRSHLRWHDVLLFVNTWNLWEN